MTIDGGEGITTRLSELMAGMSVSAFARKCGLPDASIRQYFKGSVPGADKAAQIAERNGVTLEWLVTGRGERHREEQFGRDASAVLVLEHDEKTYSMLTMVERLRFDENELFSLELAEHEDPLLVIGLPADWLQQRGMQPEHVRVWTHRDDTMEPTIRNGDVLLIDTSRRALQRDGIHIVREGGRAKVRRVHWRRDGGLRIMADNPAYPAEEYAAAETDQLEIIGRVMWFGRGI